MWHKCYLPFISLYLNGTKILQDASMDCVVAITIEYCSDQNTNLTADVRRGWMNTPPPNTGCVWMIHLMSLNLQPVETFTKVSHLYIQSNIALIPWFCTIIVWLPSIIHLFIVWLSTVCLFVYFWVNRLGSCQDTTTDSLAWEAFSWIQASNSIQFLLEQMSYQN